MKNKIKVSKGAKIRNQYNCRRDNGFFNSNRIDLYNSVHTQSE